MMMVPPKHIAKLSEDDIKYLEKFPEPQQAVLMATRELEKPTYVNLSIYLGVPVGTVKSRLSRARQQLAKLKRRDAIVGDEGGSHSGTQEV